MEYEDYSNEIDPDSYSGAGSGEDDFADYNQNESDDHRDDTGSWIDQATDAERNA